MTVINKRANPSVVNITIYTSSGNQLSALGQGSGFLYDTNGNIVTNSHVVEEAKEVEVTFSDGTVRPAEIVGVDLHSDLAVIKVSKLPEGIAPLPLGVMEEIQVGETVVAIGNPFGLDGTLTKGIVSAVGRTIPSLTAFSIPMAIQTDAAINPGNSGGPLLNLKGEENANNAQNETSNNTRSNTAVGFAIPLNQVQRVVPELIKNGSYTWPWLGVRGGTLSPYQAEAMKLPVEKGAYLSEIVKGGPAEKIGLQGRQTQPRWRIAMMEIGGDVVVAIDGQPIRSFDDMLIYVAFHTSPDQDVTLTLIRDGKTIDVKLKMEPRPKDIQTQD